eukprot:g37313.t1
MVLLRLIGLKVDKSPRRNGLHPRVLKEMAEEIVEALVVIFHHWMVLTSTVMKCFERLVMAHINSSLPACLDPLHFIYQHYRSSADAISLALHSFLEHLDNKDTYVRLLLIDYSSTFNTIIPSRLISKLRDLSFGSALCNWILTHRLQSVRIERKEKNTAPIYINGTEVERVKSIKFLR